LAEFVGAKRHEGVSVERVWGRAWGGYLLKRIGGGDFLPDGSGRFLHGAVRGDDADTIRVGQRESLIALADAVEEIAGLGFHSVEAVHGGFAEILAATGFAGIEVEDEGKTGEVRPDGKGVEALNDLGGETSTGSLVNRGGIEEAIAEHPDSLIQSGDDHLADEFGTTGEKEQELGFLVHAPALRSVFEEVTDGFAERSTARLAGDKDSVTEGGETVGEALNLGGFSGSFTAFQRDETGFGGHEEKPVKTGSTWIPNL
jgi:hypothetical protein